MTPEFYEIVGKLAPRYGDTSYYNKITKKDKCFLTKTSTALFHCIFVIFKAFYRSIFL